jgi:hypothetical protein
MPTAVQNYGDLPLSFEANQGQASNSVRFLSRGSGYTFFLTPGEAVLAFSQNRTEKDRAEKDPTEKGQNDTHTVLHMRLDGSSGDARVSGVDPLPGTSNYFYGQDSSQWRTGVPTYRKVAYDNIYPGIKLVYYGNQRQLEYDFVVSPGADPSVIRLSIGGANKVAVDGDGNLILHSDDGDVRLLAPKAYQNIHGQRREIAGHWQLAADNTAGFQLAAYDHGQALVIDPVLLYSSFLGGSQNTTITRIATDAAGNAYVAGYTNSGDFPASPTPESSTFGGGTTSRGAFVAKIDPTGSSLLYTTYLSGSVDEKATGLAVDASGNVYVTGNTHSPDFPVMGAFHSACAVNATGSCSDAFLTKIAPAGNSLVYSTYLGGTGDDAATSLAVDASGNAYVAGVTSSKDFPATAGAAQIKCGGACNLNAFVAKFNSFGTSLTYATYLGGSGSDGAADMAVDASGNVYVTGQTSSADFPVTGAFQKTCALDASSSSGECVATSFVAKLKADGSGLNYSTYLGGSLGSKASGIAVDSAGSAYITGSTHSADFPVSNAFQKSCGIAASAQCAVNAFVTKLTAAGSALVYSTYLGGSTQDEATAIALDAAGNAHVVGSTASADFPTSRPLQSKLNGTSDAFVAALSATGKAVSFSTFHGGSSTETGSSVALDAKGNIYITGQTASGDFPTLTPFQSSCAGSCSNAFVSKLTPIPQAGTPATITASAGSGQSAVIGAAFTNALAALVLDGSSNPVSGVNVTFTAPGSGASGTFPGPSATATVATDATGTATATTLTANNTVGAYTVVATVSPVATGASFSLTNTPGAANSITATAGGGQTTAEGTAFTTALKATVLDSGSNPVPGVAVTFTAPGSGASGTFSSGVTATVNTNASGVATAPTFTANSTAGGYTVNATVVGVVTPAPFLLTNGPGAPNSVSVTGGNNQSATISTAFATALQVTVLDNGNNPVPSITVTFTAPGSGASGKFANSTVTTTATTNGSGVATASTFTANGTSGSYTVNATVAGVATPGAFSLTNNAGAPATITATAGGGQSAAEGTAFATALQATVKDSGSNPVSGVSVTFTAPGGPASGTFPGPSATATVTTDASGVATAPTFTASSHVGTYTVTANTTPTALGTAASFSLTNTHGSANTIAATAGGGQTVPAGTAFGTALQATVTDNGSNPVPNVAVTFTAPGPGASGTFSNNTATITVNTNSSGVASETFTANCTLGSFNVTASVSGVGTPATFGLTITVGTPKTVQATAGTPQATPVGSAFPTQLVATVVDCGGNPEPAGITVTFTAPSGGATGTFADTSTNSTTAPTNALGVATAAVFTANSKSGAYTVSGTATGATTSASYALSNSSGPPAAVTPVTGTSPQSAAVNTAFLALGALVTDSHGNPVKFGVPVTFTATATGAGASGTFQDTGTNTTMANTNAGGVATPAAFTANTKADTNSYSVTASTAGASTSASYVLTNVPGPPAAITNTIGTPQNVAVTNTFGTLLSGTVTDQYSNPELAGVAVKLTAPGSGASGKFANGTATTTVNTVAGGAFTGTALTANSTAGAYNVSATSSTGTASAQYALVNSNFALSSTSPSIYIQGTSVPIATSAAPVITVTPLPAPPANSYTGTVTLACVNASLPTGVTCPSFTPPTAVFANGSPASVLSAATVNISASTPVGLYQTTPVMVVGTDSSAKPVTNTTSFGLAVECSYSLGNTANVATLPVYSPLTVGTPFTLFVSEDAGGSNCPWDSLTTTAGIIGVSATSGTITAPGTGSPVVFGVNSISNNASSPQTDTVSVSYFQVNGATTTGTSMLAVTQEPSVTLTGGVGTTSIGIAATNPGTLAFPSATGLTAGVTTICGAENSSGADTSGNNYFITCSATVTGGTAQLNVTVGAATPASRKPVNRAQSDRAQLELLYSAGLGFPAIVFMGLGAAAFAPKRKRAALRRVASLLGILLLLSLMVVLPACSGGFSANFINPSQVGSYTITVMGYVTDVNNNVTAIEIFTVPMNVVK